MQIDFHHTTTYVCARAAGFGHREAETVAYCAQYVDDATNAGTILFSNGAMYRRISSAHKALDYRNFEKLANHHVWIPFHFLPGNGQARAGENPAGSFVEKIVCRPGSLVARDMVAACIAARDTSYGLHRLGVSMHVLADTWAHQGFAGINHAVNDVQMLDDQDRPDDSFRERLKDFFKDRFDRTASRFVGGALPLGHGAVLSYPDRPYLQWRYRDHNGRKVARSNPEDFLDAADALCRAMQRYRVGDADADVPGLAPGIRPKIDHLLRTTTHEDGHERHRIWLERIGEGYFGFPPVKLGYKPKGHGSWKHQALGTRRFKDKKSEKFQYDPSFLGCDWKLFHDAIQAHRFTLIHNILPRYGICAA